MKAIRLALRFAGVSRIAGPLRDISKLRYQAVFLMGAGGSGKGFVGQKWMKYMPGGGESPQVDPERLKQTLTEQERGLSNLQFEKTVENLAKKGITLQLQDASHAALPFKLYSYDHQGKKREIPPEEWEETLPGKTYQEVRGLTQVVFGTPKHELPSYWRQVNPDLYKEELAGYLEKEPGYVHEMSSQMSRSYFDAAIQTGDPIFVDGTGANVAKMADQFKAAQRAGYRVSLVYVVVPLTVNQIRNLTRSRHVDPKIVTQQWKLLQDNYITLSGLADKAKVVVNRNDQADIKAYRQNEEAINQEIAQKTPYGNLYELIKAENPRELSDWGSLIKP